MRGSSDGDGDDGGGGDDDDVLAAVVVLNVLVVAEAEVVDVEVDDDSVKSNSPLAADNFAFCDCYWY